MMNQFKHYFKTKQSRRFLRVSILGILFLIIILHTQWNYHNMSKQFETVSVRIKSEGTTLQKIQNAEENEKKEKDYAKELTAFAVQEHTEIMEPDFERKVSVTVFKVYGNMEQVLPMKLILGNYPYREDTYGCVLDKNTAFALFGSLNVIGNKIVFNKKDYYVRGIVEDTISLMLIQTNDRNEVFYYLEFLFPGEENGRNLAENYLLSHSLASDYTIVEGKYIVKLIGNIIGLPLVILLIGWLFKNYQRGIKFLQHIQFENRKKSSQNRRFTKKEQIESILLELIVQIKYRKGKAAVLFLWTVTNIYLLLFAVYKYFYFPKRFLPTRWSDFSHWTSKFNEFLEHYNEIIMLVPFKKDIILMQEVWFNLGLSALAILILIMIWLYQEKNEMKSYEK